MDEEITPAQAAKLTGHTDRTIRRWIASGKLPARQIANNRYTILTSDLNKAIGQNVARQTKTTLMQAQINTLEQRVELLEKQFAGLAYQHIRVLEQYVALKAHRE